MGLNFAGKKQYAVILVLFFLALFMVPGCSKEGGDPRTTIKIIHLNDVHSHLDPGEISLNFDGKATGCEIGGMARVATMISQLKGETENNLVLHSGDAVQGTLYYTMFKGKADAEVMNAIGFDAMAIGNHEFDDGDEWLAGFSALLDAPLLSSNIHVESGTVLDGCFKSYLITEVGKDKIGIIGLTVSEKTKRSSRPGKEITFNREVASVQSAVDELTALGVYKIILLSHYGYENAKAMASEITEIDIIVDGDSHSLLGDFSAYGLDSSGDYPTVVKNAQKDNVCIVQAWEYGKALGELDITFLGNSVESWSGKSHLILGETFTREDEHGNTSPLKDRELQSVQAIIKGDGQLNIVKDDNTIAEIINSYSTVMDDLRKKVIGSAGEDLMHGRVPGHEYNGVTLAQGSDIAPLVAKAFYDQDPNADISIQNAGGTRISINKGEITYDTAYTLLPFSNTLFEIEMSGSEIKQVLEDAIENIAKSGSTGSFPYCYGVKYDVDATGGYGSRVSNLEVKDRQTGAYSAMTQAMYVVVTSNYLAEGLDGYDTFATVQAMRGKGTDTYLSYAMSFVNHVKELTASDKELIKLPDADYCIKSYTPTPDADDAL